MPTVEYTSWTGLHKEIEVSCIFLTRRQTISYVSYVRHNNKERQYIGLPFGEMTDEDDPYASGIVSTLLRLSLSLVFERVVYRNNRWSIGKALIHSHLCLRT